MKPYTKQRSGAAMLRATMLLGTAMVLLFVRVARADPPSDADRARAVSLMRQGLKAASAKQWKACIQAYKAALEIEESPKVTGDLGLCEERAGRFVDAYNHLHQALQAGPTEPKETPWIGYQAALDRVRDRVAVLFVTAIPTNAAILLDGRPLGKADGRAVAVEPGPHRVLARLEGYEDAVDERAFVAPSSPHIDLRLTPKPKAVPASEAVKATKPAKAPESKPALAPLPWYTPAPTVRGVLVPLAGATAALALASGSTTAIFEAQRASLTTQVGPSDCAPSKPSPPEVCSEIGERFEQRNIALGVTLGAVVTTAVLGGAAGVVIGLERKATTPQILPSASANGGGLLLVGSW